MKYTFLFTFLLVTIYSSAQCVDITSIDVKTSRCQNSGSIIVHANGGPRPYVYEIITVPSGFAMPPVQTDSLFDALMPGNYRVRVIDNNTCKDTISFTITGNYTIMSPSASTTPTTCPAGNDGTISVSLPFGQGRAPFMYETVNPSPVIKSLQPSNVLTGLTAGTYTYRIWDSCGNFQTRTTTVGAGDASYTANLCAFWAGCDSTEVWATISASQHKLPYTVTWVIPSGDTVREVITTGSGFIRSILKAQGGPGTTFKYQVRNNCGVTTSWVTHIVNNYPLPFAYGAKISCTANNYTITYGGNCQSRTSPIIAYKLINSLGDTVASQTSNIFTGFPVGNYRVLVVTRCAITSNTFSWQAPSAPTYTLTQNKNQCKAGATSLIFQSSNTSGPVTVVVTSGPDSIRFGDGSVVHYSYPDTITKNLSGYKQQFFYGAGAYSAVFKDTCGVAQIRNITVLSSQLKGTVTFRAYSPMSCPGSNKIIFEWASQYAGEQGRIHSVPLGALNGINPNQNFNGTGKDSVSGMPNGTYILSYNMYDPVYPYQMPPIFVSAGITCDQNRDTVTVPGLPYINPIFNNPAIAVCATGTSVALIPDLTKGVPRYQYEITSGPGGARPLQNSPVFGSLAAGTYNFRMSDACGNSYSRSLYIDTLGFSPITTLGTGCLGSNSQFIAQPNPYYQHKWIKPDASTFMGDTLNLNPVVASDFGNYTMELYCNISGCRDTIVRTAVFNDCVPLPLGKMDFSARKSNCIVTVRWRSLDNALTELQQSTNGVDYVTIAKGTAMAGAYTRVEVETKGKLLFRLLTHNIANNSIEYSDVLYVNNACQLNNDWRISPNPATDNITIDGLEETTQAVIINNVGEKVWQGQLSATQNTIMLTNLPAGLYHLQVNSFSEFKNMNFIKL